MKRILVTGGTGQVGWELQRALHPIGHVIAPERGALDLARPQHVGASIDALEPDVIVNAAAYTAVDRAESEVAMAHAINAASVGELGLAAAARGIPVIHLSTDYVFGDDTAHARTEEAATAPLNAYGRTKLDGERALFDSGAAAIVLRTTWVYGVHGANFLKTVLRLATTREEARIVSDQVGAPTWARTLAQLIRAMMSTGSSTLTDDDIARLKGAHGVYHVCARGETNWHAYARLVVGLAREHPIVGRTLTLDESNIVAIPTEAYPTPAARPRNSRLVVDKFEAVFGARLPRWDHDVIACTRHILDAMQTP